MSFSQNQDKNVISQNQDRTGKNIISQNQENNVISQNQGENVISQNRETINPKNHQTLCLKADSFFMTQRDGTMQRLRHGGLLLLHQLLLQINRESDLRVLPRDYSTPVKGL